MKQELCVSGFSCVCFGFKFFFQPNYLFFYILKRFLNFIFRQRRREGEGEGEKHQCVVASRVSPTGVLACNPGMFPDWELNWQPFGLQAGTRAPEPHQPGNPPNYLIGTHRAGCSMIKKQKPKN